MKIEKVLIDKNDFQKHICNLILTQTYKKYTDNMHTTNREEFEAGFIQGLCWATLLTAELDILYLERDK